MRSRGEERPWDRLREPSREAAGGGSGTLPLSFLSTLPRLMKVALRPFPGWAQPAPRQGAGGARTPAESGGSELLLARPPPVAPLPPSGKMPCASHLKIPGDTRVVNRISDATRDPGSSSAIPRHLGGWEASSRSCAARDLLLSSAGPSCSEQWPMTQL